MAATTGWCGVAFDEGETDSGEMQRVKPGAGAPALTASFRKAHNAANPEHELTRKLLELGRSGDTAQSIGYRSLTGKPVTSRQGREAKKRRDEEDRFALRTAQDILDARLEAIEARLRSIGDRLEQIEDSLGTLDELDQLQASGRLDPRNPRHAALLRQAGISPEDVATKDIPLLLLEKRGGLAGERDGLLRERQDLQDEKAAVTAARADLARDPDDPGALARARLLAKSDNGAELLGAVAATTKSDAVKIAAADAVAGGTEFQTLARDAATKTDALFAKSDKLDWDDPSPAKPAPAGGLPKPG